MNLIDNIEYMKYFYLFTFEKSHLFIALPFVIECYRKYVQ